MHGSMDNVLYTVEWTVFDTQLDGQCLMHSRIDSVQYTVGWTVFDM